MNSSFGRTAAQGDYMRRHLKVAIAAILMALGTAGVAPAADMAVKAQPIVAPVTPWSSCYIGGNVGGGWSRMDTTRLFQDVAVPAFANYGRENESAFIGGGQVGCDFQTGNLVFGVQGMFDFGNVNGRHQLTDFPTFSETNSLKYVITATGRIGYLFTPQLLAYGKFGVAFMRNSNSVFQPSGALSESASFTLPGMDAGGGLEYMFAPHWGYFGRVGMLQSTW